MTAQNICAEEEGKTFGELLEDKCDPKTVNIYQNSQQLGSNRPYIDSRVLYSSPLDSPLTKNVIYC